MNVKSKNLIVVAVPIVVLWMLFSTDPVRQVIVTAVRSLTFTMMWDVWKGSKLDWNDRSLEIPKGKYWWSNATASDVTLQPRDSRNTGLITIRAAEAGKDYLVIAKSRCRYRICEPIPLNVPAGNGTLLVAFQVIGEDGSQLRYATILDKERKFLVETVSTPSAFSADIATALSISQQLSQPEVQKRPN